MEQQDRTVRKLSKEMEVRLPVTNSYRVTFSRCVTSTASSSWVYPIVLTALNHRRAPMNRYATARLLP